MCAFEGSGNKLQTPKPSNLNPKPQTLNPKPSNLNPKLEPRPQPLGLSIEDTVERLYFKAVWEVECIEGAPEQDHIRPNFSTNELFVEQVMLYHLILYDIYLL